MRIVVTFRVLFTDSIQEISPTDLVTHHIPTYPGAVPKPAKIHLYTEREREWQKEVFPKLIEAQVLTTCNSGWSLNTRFVLKTPLQIHHPNNQPAKRYERFLDTMNNTKHPTGSGATQTNL